MIDSRFSSPCKDSQPCVATIGFFDGLHRGHRCLIDQVIQLAKQRSLSSAVVTFPVHPRQVMSPDYAPHLLTTFEEKMALLAQTPIDRTILIPFTPQLAQKSAREFMLMLRQEYHVQALVIGYDHRFGHNRSEGFADYVRYGQEMGMEVVQATPLDKTEIQVSSSRIRQLVSDGAVDEAALQLGYPYFIEGEVESGYQVGRTIGFPTANLLPNDPQKLIPADGVYAVKVRLTTGATYNGMLCIGHRPTLQNGPQRSIEVHLFDFTGNLYRQTIHIAFIKYTRQEQRFDSIEALRQRIALDEQEIRQLLAD